MEYPKKRALVYIDGLNLYEAAISERPHRKWLDLQAYCSAIHPHDDILRINYFITRLSKARPEVMNRQLVYLDALSTLPKVSIIYGRFGTGHETCRVRRCLFPGNRAFEIQKEKKTDVALAVQMVRDGYENKAEVYVLISADTDFVPAVQALGELKKEVVIYTPGRQASGLSEVSRIARIVTLPENLIEGCQFPNELRLASGRSIRRPTEWH